VDLFEKLKEKLKSFNLQKLNLNSKLVTNLVIILAVGIVLILVSDFYKDLNPAGTTSPNTDNTNITNNQSSDSKSDAVVELENRLTEILSKIQNTGKVSVMITLKSGSEIIPAKDESITDKTTDEKDVDGGTRAINEKNTSDQVVFLNNQGGTSQPLVLKEINPDIKGVIIVAEGAKDPRVKLQLTEAVQTVLDVPAYRVSVFESNK
jgi:stage III sporulation protein AG